jgi:hypothetical protein
VLCGSDTLAIKQQVHSDATAVINKAVKRGVSFTSKEGRGPSQSDLDVLARHGVTWWYNWGSDGRDSSLDFVPMIWGLGHIGNAASKIRAYKDCHPGARYLLVLNEPNHKGQANTTPQEAARLWPAVEELARECELALVGPQLCFGHMEGFESPVDWLDAFIAEYKTLYGGLDPQIDALGYHFYGSSGLRGHLDALTRFGKPLWITEFAHYHAAALEDQMKWMTKAVYLCEARSDVARYAWFIGRAEEHKLIRSIGREEEFNVGTDVEARYAGCKVKKDWCQGVISAVHSNKTYNIVYKNGQQETGVGESMCLSLLGDDGTLNQLGQHYVGLPHR